jgi:hypothetical protein
VPIVELRKNKGMEAIIMYVLSCPGVKVLPAIWTPSGGTLEIKYKPPIMNATLNMSQKLVRLTLGGDR